jgi:hypothetical protein
VADPSLALHKALLARMSSLTVPVFDAVRQGQAYPYVTVDYSIAGEVNHLRERLDERFVYLTVWSETRGQEEVLRIIGEIDALLDGAKLSLDTGTAVSIKVDRKATQRDADNVTFMGTVTLRVLTKH